MYKRITFLAIFFGIHLSFFAQGKVKGRVFNAINNESVPFATVAVKGLNAGAITDLEGNYEINNLEAGLYTFEASYVGFESNIIYEIEVTNAKTVFLDFPLNEISTQLQEVEVKASPFSKSADSPVSLRTIGVAEIQRAPGGNRDISRVIQNLPGVASTASFRNDIIIRGGAPNENRFYLDDIEVPNINHFTTQGSSGGPVGLINVNLISEVEYFAGAFPANRGNMLSSLFQFTQKEGNPEKIAGNFMVGSSDIGLTLDGPVSKKSTFTFSLRRSYLQFLFQALKLPFLPTYTDNQFKYTVKFNPKNRLSVIGLGALDRFSLNSSVNNGVTDSATINRNEYILGNIPKSDQWNYTIGAVYKHYGDKGYQTWVVSRNHLNNTATKYVNNDESTDDNLLLKYASDEVENKFRFEHNTKWKGFNVNIGLGYENVLYKNSTVNKQVIINGANTEVNFNSNLTFNKYALFGQINKSFLERRLVASLGIRTDFNDYSKEMIDPIEQLSPRLSFSYSLTEKWNLNFNTGRYFQLPPYTVMGYRDASGVLVNKQNNLKYISVNHLVAGVEYNSSFNSKITLEGFYKVYYNYPFSLRDSVSLANLGADFGVIGNEPIVSVSKGRTYGLEVLAQQKLSKGFYGILAYTFVRSEFSGLNENYIPSSWDFGHIINITGGKKFKDNWEIGMRFRFSGGAPYTPYDLTTSAFIPVWNVLGQGVLDYSQLNSLRLPNTHQLDVRVDKRFYYERWSLNVYLDIQNIYASEVTQAPFLNVVKDSDGSILINEMNPQLYQIQLIENVSNTVLPSIGVMIEF